jgi:hypothetical protein
LGEVTGLFEVSVGVVGVAVTTGAEVAAVGVRGVLLQAVNKAAPTQVTIRVARNLNPMSFSFGTINKPQRLAFPFIVASET